MIPGWRAFSAASSALVLLVGCGSSADSGRGAASDTGTSATVDTRLDTIGPEPTDTAERTRGNGDPPVINVGGARLDGKSDTTAWPPKFELYEGQSKAALCKAFALGADASVPVTVDVSLSSSQFFKLLPGGENCNNTNQGDCRGFTFRPGDRATQGCRVNIEASRPSGGRAQATVTFTFQSRCTSTAGKPCDDPKVAAAAPSSGNPVLVAWTPQVDAVTAEAIPCLLEEREFVDGRWVCPSTEGSSKSTPPSTARTTAVPTSRVAVPPTT
ncbi:hypothetical protein FHS29_002473 [Saccharothrix tamanrassetensis]|uniref:Lipoprotein n=1 Tax=Saccharothrix tamanrassetensis TaxID=1051531 RepID=A0A841CBK3_9PSEU|nr:hypothetical protein [Saccharothrix tamanrassetensis]MBB5955892.1 hypothetical protein [Saccharothrix tamanrassetensis]